METNANQKVTCVVNYPYEASEPDELSLRPGELLADVERLPGGWWRGELRGRRGMFPDNFVAVVEPGGRPGVAQGRCRAVFSYAPANPDELPLSVGDVLDVLGEVEEGWWQGRRAGKVGVFPSNFVVMLDTAPAPAAEPAPALPPKPVKELCRVLFPYAAVNEDELSLAEGDVVAVLSRDAPDRGWWRGELAGRVGLFPDNFVQLLPAVTHTPEEDRKPERPPPKSTSPLYPVLNKYSEKTTSIKELSTSKISLHKDNTVSKESSAQGAAPGGRGDDDHSDAQIKKPPVPSKKSPPAAAGGVGGLLSGLKNKVMSSVDKGEKGDKDKDVKDKENKDKDKPPSSLEWETTDGGALSRAGDQHTLDKVPRNSILNDPRASRVKAPRRRPPSQALRDDTPQLIGISNGHDAPASPAAAEEIKPRAREWERHRAPWMDELKLNQAKKTESKTFDGEEKKSSISVEMSKSTSSISSRMSVLESFEETTKVRHSLDSKKDAAPRDDRPVASPPPGKTFTSLLEEVKKPQAPSPPLVSVRTTFDHVDKSTSKTEKTVTSEKIVSIGGNLAEMSSTVERTLTEEKYDKPTVNNGAENNGAVNHGAVNNVAVNSGAVNSGAVNSGAVNSGAVNSMERLGASRAGEGNASDALIAQLNDRITNLENLLEVQGAKFAATVEALNAKLAQESKKRQALQSEVDKLAQCVTQV